jgi:predicted acetyltransferase
MSIEIRKYLDGFDDRRAALRAGFLLDETIFGEPFHEDDLDSPAFDVSDDDRTVYAWDGDEIDGTSANFAMDTSTPGGSLATAGVTFIGVKPTHRRRGVMTAMLDNLHQDGIDREEPIATLWAADSAIYPRFDYGLATYRLAAEIPHQYTRFLDGPDDSSISLRMVDTATDFEHVAPVYEANRQARAGAPALTEAWNRRHIWDPERHREGATGVQTVLAEDANGVRGYLRYALKSQWPDGYGEGTVTIYRLMSTDAAAHAALWRYCFSLDLMTKTSWWNVPIDDPVLTWLEQPRPSKRRINDAMWVRVLDVGKSLAGRTYASDIDVTMKIRDRRIDANDGTWRLKGGPDGASCERVTESPDLSLDVRTLGAILLGGPTLVSHANAGWVDEHTSGALRAASIAFSADLAPYCPFVF